jgi:outer membrane protein
MKRTSVKTIILSLAGILVLTVIAWGLRSTQAKAKIGWIDLNKVYDGFELKKELEAKLDITRVGRKKVLDSLEFDIMILSKTLESKKADVKAIALLQSKKEFYIKQKRSFDVDDETARSGYQAQILTQINQFVKDYGEKQGFAYIVGADGTGTLMYANKEFDLTDELKEYINERYKGLQK